MKKLESIQFARAIAAIIVLFAHMSKEMMHKAESIYNDPLWIWNFGQAGVDLFFVISGFIMVYVAHKDIGSFSGASKFLRKRLVRVVPPYWLYTSLALLVAVVVPSLRNFHDTDFFYALGSFFFLPMERPADGEVTPLYALGWTLNYEMYFYVCFSLLMRLNPRIFNVAFVTYFVTTVALGQLLDLRDVSPALWYWTRPVVLEFVLGGILGMLYLKSVTLSNRMGVAWLLSGIVWWLVGSILYPAPEHDARLLVWGVPAALVLGSLVLAETNFYDWLPKSVQSVGTAIGDASYSLYLSHMFIIRIATLLMPVSVLGPSYLLVYPVVCTLACLAFARLSYMFFEVPTNSFGRRWVS